MNTKELFRANKVFNTWDVLKRFAPQGKDVAISYTTPDSRSCMCARSSVFSPSHKTDPHSHWSDYGKKSFLGRRSISMPKAMQWAGECYGIKEWAPCPVNTAEKIPKEVLRIAKKWLKEQPQIHTTLREFV